MALRINPKPVPRFIVRLPPRIIALSKKSLVQKARKKHDAGGTKRWVLQPGISGDAVFSQDGHYRHILRRVREQGEGYILWIGHNPSVAEGDIDDPTIRREMFFTWREGAKAMIKLNIMDYRATHPEDLLDDTYRNYLPSFSVNNYALIDTFAKEAKLVVLCYGALNPKWMPIAHRVMDELEKYKHKVVCLGKTQAGFPRHPLYVSNSKQFEFFYAS